jgi:hypothetical protein
LDLGASWGGKRACKGSRLEPSPIEANDLCFWFLIDRMKPLTVTLVGSACFVSRRCATDNGAAAYVRGEEWNARLRHVCRRGWTILIRVLDDQLGS